MKDSAQTPRLYAHRCAVCGCEWRTPFPPKKGIQVHCTSCHARLVAGDPPDEIRRDAHRAGAAGAVQEYMGKKRTVYDAVCTSCGGACRVPFVPLEGQEILCRSCYRARRHDENGDGSCGL